MGYLARLACVAMVLALSGAAYAQPTKADEARAAALKKQGDVLVHDSKFREALQKYDESFAIVPNPAIHYNRGRALQSLGDFPAALDELESFVATAPPELKAKVPNIDKTIGEIASHVATLVVRCEVAGAAVTVGGKSVGATPLKPLHTNPGEVTITVTAPGYVVFTQATTLAAGESTSVEAKLAKTAAEPVTSNKPEPTPFDQPTSPTGPTPPPQEHPTGGGRGPWRTVAWISGGVGVAAVGAGIVFLGLSISDKNSADPHCPNKQCDPIGRQSINEAWTFADVSTALVVVGGVALALSLTSFLITPKSAPVQARLFVGPASAGIGGSF